MAHRVVAAHARELAARFVHGVDHLHDLMMTLPAGLLGDLAVPGVDLDRFVEVSGRERVRVPEAVHGLGGVLGEMSRRRVAIVAGGHRAMARLQPATG